MGYSSVVLHVPSLVGDNFGTPQFKVGRTTPNTKPQRG